ncbi:MAG: hypothetical protein D6725_11350 [Planctomycetota bacterium]|nr:MAG: hypothetical protein D6725_11350 [Planctomycetota bacterium]
MDGPPAIDPITIHGEPGCVERSAPRGREDVRKVPERERRRRAGLSHRQPWIGRPFGQAVQFR